MKRFALLGLLLATLITSYGQKTIHDANAQVRKVSGYSAVKVSTGIDLYLSYGDELVAVSAKTNEDRDHIKTEVENGVLKITYDWKDGKNLLSINRGRELKAYVSYKTLNAIGASGGSDVHIDGTLKANTLSLNVSGGSDLKGKLDVNELKVNASGGADVNVTGRADKVNIDVSGGSDFTGYEFQTETAVVDASGGSDVRITVNKDLDVRSSGASDVYYKGNAVIKEIRSSGASSIKKVSK